MLELILDLAELFPHLLERTSGRRPVESDTGCAILQPVRAMQGWKSGWQSFHQALTLPGLHPFPRLADAVAVQMRVATFHLRNESFGDVLQRERPALLGDDGMKEDLQQQVAELFAEARVVPGEQCLVHLVRLFYKVWPQRVVGLSRIPLAAAPQIAHERDRIFKRRFHLLDSPMSRYTTRRTNDRSMRRLMTRAWVEVDLGALVRNAELFQRAANVPLLPMVKADAYGLGAVRVARALLAVQPWGFGVATIEEGEELRRAAIDLPILVFSPPLAVQLDAVRRARLRPVLGDVNAIRQWSATRLPWHLAIDTGMSRAGVAWRDASTVRELVAAHPPEGACTHFHSAQFAHGSREEQEKRFAVAIEALGIRPPQLLHADNSAAIEHRSPSPYDLARPGIFLYGVGSGHDATIEPEPVVALRGRVVEVRVVQEGDSVSYDATWRAPRAGRIATVSVGYADGYRRALGNRANALLSGRRVPVVGTVTMDMTMVDATDEKCAVGDIVTFLGRDGDTVLTVADVAKSADLSPYELLTGLRSRIARLYVDGDT